MNLILIKDKIQEKDNMELLKNVKVNLINNFMQLNELNNNKEILILKKFKQVYN